ncbi:MAG: UDP-3-O-(3-hydroxymyristoyl)glucosamine N-acyltransferase [Planctomycetes bacterium]|nr:UDP-3-O-(3-hydroxymyristoyl)glucosamine N-acyltransferase [Planctomycetota bacterium]
MMDATVAALAELVGGRVVGDGARRIVGLGDLRTAGPDRIGFVRNVNYHALAAATRAGAVLTSTELATEAVQILVRDVDLAYAKVANLFHPRPRAAVHSIHPTAVVDPAAELEAPVVIGPHAVVGRCRLGAGTVVMAGVSIGDDTTIGRDGLLYPGVVVYGAARIGDRVILHAGVVVGSDGFGYAREGTSWIKVPQLGTVVLEDDVELGVGTAVDRATLGTTSIGARTKIDNHCHIAHNCTIGADTVMAAGCMVAGSTRIGARCVFGGSSVVNGHIQVCDDARFGGDSRVLKDVDKPGEYWGYPLVEKRQWLRLLQKLRAMVVPAARADTAPPRGDG